MNPLTTTLPPYSRSDLAVPRASDAPFEHIADPKFTPDLAHVDNLAFVSERGITSDDEQPVATRERRDDVLYDARTSGV
jgi:hypothetical protein